MSMKKLLALLLAVVMVFGLVACNPTNPTEPTNKPTGKKHQPAKKQTAKAK